MAALAGTLAVPAGAASFTPSGGAFDFFDQTGSVNGQLFRGGSLLTDFVDQSASNEIDPGGLIASGETSGGMIDPASRIRQGTRGSSTPAYIAELSSVLTSEIVPGLGGTTNVRVGVEHEAWIDQGFDKGSGMQSFIDTAWILDLTDLPGPTKFSWKVFGGTTPELLVEASLDEPGMIMDDMLYPGQYLMRKIVTYEALVEEDGEEVHSSASELAVLRIGIIPLPSVAGLGSLGLFCVLGRRGRRIW